MRKELTGHFILLSLIKSSWNDFGISESYDFQKFYVVFNFEFLLYKLSLSLVYYRHIFASVGNENIS